MIHVYDILLNFNKYLIEFFEWEDDDDINYIKKICLFKISSEDLDIFINKRVLFDETFLFQIKDSCSFYDEENCIDNSYVILVTDGLLVVGLKIINKEIMMVSRLLLDEEDEILEMVDDIILSNIKYEVIGNKPLKEINLTRYECSVKDELVREINYLYKNSNIEKLRFYYYEYFNEISDDINFVYNRLIDDINNNYSNNHVKLYDIIKLSYQNK